jgi:hypothetical protein
MRPALALMVSFVACSTERSATPQPAPGPVALPPVAAKEPPVTSAMPTPKMEPASAPTLPAPQTAATELLGDELLVLRAPIEPRLRALRRSPTEPAYLECELMTTESYAHLDLIRGEIRVTRRKDDWPVKHTCELVRVDSKFSRLEHPFRPLTRDHLGELVLGLPPAEQAAWLTNPDLEKGPLRGVVGRETGVVVFGSAFLNDLGTHFAVPHRPLLTRAELESDLEARRTAGKRVARLNRPDLFAPQVADASERLALSKLPVLSVTAASESYQDAGPTGVPLRVGSETRYLMFQSHMMKYSWEAAFRRGRVIDRVIEDGARSG